MNNDLREARLIIEMYKDKICKANARIKELEARNAMLQMMVDELVKPLPQEKADENK